MNTKTIPIEGLIHQLEIAGEYPKPSLIKAIWNRQEEACPLLLSVFQEAFLDDWDSKNDPRWYRLKHAGKFMLSWQVEESLPFFTKMYLDDALHDICEWFEEEPAYFGPMAIPHFSKVLDKEVKQDWDYGVALSAGILAKISVFHPEHKEQVAKIFRAKLPPLEQIPLLKEPDYNGIWSSICGDLAALSDVESKPQVLALLDADMIDPMLMDRKSYLREFNNRSYRPVKVNLVVEYESQYKRHMEHQEHMESIKKKEEKQSKVKLAKPRSEPKVGRNEPCPCGSGKKYKKCHGRPGG